jgi:anti-sigma factor ChrR (cupin superfamily)
MTDQDRINADFDQRVVVDINRLPWVPSPQAGIERRMLDRIGGEVARATSLVRYAPASTFPEHVHGMGEEFLVLDGVFSDEHGDYPAGTYVRNPPGSRHAPRTAAGCTIFVKLRQMQPAEQERRVIDTAQAAWQDGTNPGHRSIQLFADDFEHVSFERLASGASTGIRSIAGGHEFLILSGELSDRHGIYPAGTWLRAPERYAEPLTARSDATYWIKRGHLKADQLPGRE